MREGTYGLSWIFWITAIWGVLVVVGKYTGFLIAFWSVGALLALACLWYLAMCRAPEPTLYLTLAILLLAPLISVITVSVMRSREYARKEQSIDTMTAQQAEYMINAQAHPGEHLGQ